MLKAQAPFQEVTKEEYDEIVSRTRLITQFSGEIDVSTDGECQNGACPMR